MKIITRADYSALAEYLRVCGWTQAALASQIEMPSGKTMSASGLSYYMTAGAYMPGWLIAEIRDTLQLTPGQVNYMLLDGEPSYPKPDRYASLGRGMIELIKEHMT